MKLKGVKEPYSLVLSPIERGIVDKMVGANINNIVGYPVRTNNSTRTKEINGTIYKNLNSHIFITQIKNKKDNL